MSAETSKSIQFAHRARLMAQHCNGKVGIDIGCGPDPLVWPGAERIDLWDKEQGDAEHLLGIEADTYDFVHSSHCLEHMVNVSVALGRWARVLKPGGAMFITVPSFEFYEMSRLLPSVFNPDHKAAFCVCPLPGFGDMGGYHSVGSMIRLGNAVGLTLVELYLELHNYDFAARASRFCIDQTLSDATAQVFFLFIKELERGRMPPSPDLAHPQYGMYLGTTRVCPKCQQPLADGETKCQNCR